MRDVACAGNMAHLLNHSCEPNSYSRTITVRCPDTGTLSDHVVIFAKRAIAAGEELTYDYRCAALPAPDDSTNCTSFQCSPVPLALQQQAQETSCLITCKSAQGRHGNVNVGRSEGRTSVVQVFWGGAAAMQLRGGHVPRLCEPAQGQCRQRCAAGPALASEALHHPCCTLAERSRLNCPTL